MYSQYCQNRDNIAWDAEIDDDKRWIPLNLYSAVDGAVGAHRSHLVDGREINGHTNNFCHFPFWGHHSSIPDFSVILRKQDGPNLTEMVYRRPIRNELILFF